MYFDHIYTCIFIIMAIYMYMYTRDTYYNMIMTISIVVETKEGCLGYWNSY